MNMCSGVSKTRQTFNALLEASQPQFIIAKGYPIGSARAKDTRWNLEKTGTISHMVRGHMCVLLLPATDNAVI